MVCAKCRIYSMYYCIVSILYVQSLNQHNKRQVEEADSTVGIPATLRGKRRREESRAQEESRTQRKTREREIPVNF